MKTATYVGFKDELVKIAADVGNISDEVFGKARSINSAPDIKKAIPKFDMKNFDSSVAEKAKKRLEYARQFMKSYKPTKGEGVKGLLGSGEVAKPSLASKVLPALAIGGTIIGAGVLAHRHMKKKKKEKQEAESKTASVLKTAYLSEPVGHALELGGLGILAAPSIAAKFGHGMNEDLQHKIELAGLGTLAVNPVLQLAKHLREGHSQPPQEEPKQASVAASALSLFKMSSQKTAMYGEGGSRAVSDVAGAGASELRRIAQQKMQQQAQQAATRSASNLTLDALRAAKQRMGGGGGVTLSPAMLGMGRR